MAGRLVTRRSASGVAVIDDTYNANPDSVRAAIDVLAAAPSPRWLVLGDMGEVGSQGATFHHEVGAYAKSAGIDRLLTVGTLTASTSAAYGAGASHFTAIEALVERVVATVAPGTTVLVKGSRVMRMERVVAALLGEAPSEGTH